MLVIGFGKDKSVHSHELDIDPTIDNPRYIHEQLKKTANGQDFDTIVVVENDAVVAEYSDEEDYDLTEDADDEIAALDDDADDEDLHEEDEQDDDE